MTRGRKVAFLATHEKILDESSGRVYLFCRYRKESA
jgi:hypothetical protein